MFKFLWKRKDAAENADTVLKEVEALPPVETARDKAAKEYFLSQEFVSAARVTTTRQLIELGFDKSDLTFRIAPKVRDTPIIETALAPLRNEFPEIKRIVVQDGGVTLDTLDVKQRNKINQRGIGGP